MCWYWNYGEGVRKNITYTGVTRSYMSQCFTMLMWINNRTVCFACLSLACCSVMKHCITQWQRQVKSYGVWTTKWPTFEGMNNTDFGSVCDHGVNVCTAPGWYFSWGSLNVPLASLVERRWDGGHSSIHCLFGLGLAKPEILCFMLRRREERSHCTAETDTSNVNTADRYSSPLTP